MKQVLPNFLIAGAAKSGTTSLYYYLMDHPEIYFSPNKEPDFLSSPALKNQYPLEVAHRPYISNIEDYYRLFEKVKNQKAIGEASTDTMYYHSTTIPRIKTILGKPRIIIILRNPPLAAFSMYSHMVRDDREELSFEEAIRLDASRKAQNYRSAYLYKSLFMYYDQVKAFLEQMDQVKVLIYEEVIIDIPGSIKQICEFLEVDAQYIPSNTSIRYNASGIPIVSWFNKLFLMKNPLQMGIRTVGTALLTPTKYVALRDSIRQQNMRKSKIHPETFAELKQTFREDILKLQNLLKKDLSVWLD